jgi:hypothetical protein
MVRGDLLAPRVIFFLELLFQLAGTSNRTSSPGTFHDELRTSSTNSLLETWSRTTESIISFNLD